MGRFAPRLCGGGWISSVISGRWPELLLPAYFVGMIRSASVPTATNASHAARSGFDGLFVEEAGAAGVSPLVRAIDAFGVVAADLRLGRPVAMPMPFANLSELRRGNCCWCEKSDLLW